MQNKLQELTDKLYNEGLSKGRQDAEQMRSKAKAEASSIINDAKAQADEIIANAKKEAQELKEKTENDVKMASNQTFTTIKQEIEKTIISKAVSEKINSAMNETEFIKSIITSVVKAFNPSNTESVALNLILPESQQKELDVFINSQIKSLCSAGLNVTFSKKTNCGFKIGPADGGYILSFTDENFRNIISEYLRPKTRALLFGKDE